MKKLPTLRDLWVFLGHLTKKFNKDHLSAYSAQATFYLMLAVFPFTMLICLASRLLPLKEETLLRLVRILVPGSYQELGVTLVDEYYNENINSLPAKIIMIIFLVWTASRLIQALINGFNMAYGIKETRSQAVIRLIGCGYTVALCVLLIVLIIMYALGSKLMAYIISFLPTSALLDLILNISRNLAAPLLLLLIFWLSYVILPSRKTRIRDEFPGALLTAVVWRFIIFLYSPVLQRSLERYSYVYGTLAGLVLILIWLYFCVYIWFVGAELNWYLKAKREGRAPKELRLFAKRRAAAESVQEPAEQQSPASPE